MIHPPTTIGTLRFVRMAALRATQLMEGCSPRVDGDHSTAVLAQLEVAAGKVTASPDPIGDSIAGRDDLA
jgi:hypothetical protein